MKSVGLDIASCTGMALVGEGMDRGKTIELPAQRGFERLQSVARAVESSLLTWEPAVVLVEYYAYTRGISTFITLVELGTVIRMVLCKHQLPWYNVGTTSLKKWTTGKGNAKKEQMADAVKQRWAYSSHSHDIVDAYALAQMGQLSRAELERIPGVFQGQPSLFTLTNKSSQLD